MIFFVLLEHIYFIIQIPFSGTVSTIAVNSGLPLKFLRNFEKKLSRIEFSPNGRFLYVANGGYAGSGSTSITYLAQIDLDVTPYEVRMLRQIILTTQLLEEDVGLMYQTA